MSSQRRKAANTCTRPGHHTGAGFVQPHKPPAVQPGDRMHDKMVGREARAANVTQPAAGTPLAAAAHCPHTHSRASRRSTAITATTPATMAIGALSRCLRLHPAALCRNKRGSPASMAAAALLGHAAGGETPACRAAQAAAARRHGRSLPAAAVAPVGLPQHGDAQRPCAVAGRLRKWVGVGGGGAQR